MATMTAYRTSRPNGKNSPRPTQAEIDAMLHAANSDFISNEIVPDSSSPPPEVTWTFAAGGAGAVLGLVTCGLLFGGFAGALVGGVAGYFAAITFAVLLWRLPTMPISPSNKDALRTDAEDDDLLDTW